MSHNAESSQRLNLPFILPSQAQKHVTHNEALARLDMTIHAAVASRTVLEPAAPEADSCYIVPEGAAGGWLGRAGEIATFDGAAWDFLPPPAGYLAYVQDEDRFIYFDGAAWRNQNAELSDPEFPAVGVNAPIDANARLSVRSPSILFSYDSDSAEPGSVRVTINKQTQAGTASAVFQNNWSSRGEVGLCGSDNLAVKVSPNGSSWKTSLEASAVTGHVRAPEGLTVGEDAGLSGRNLMIANSTAPRIIMKSNGAVGDAHMAFMSWLDGNGDEKVWCGLGSTGNSAFSFLTHYAGCIAFMTYGGNYPIEFRQGPAANQVRLRVHTNGYVGVNEAAPTAPLHVGGAIRVGASTVAALPSAASSGAGAIIYVSNESGGATLAFSDGTNWRRAHDRAVVS